MVKVQPVMGGPLTSFNPSAFMDAAEMLVKADEPLAALKLLDMVPAYYRDNRVAKIEQMKLKIRSQLFTPIDYAQDSHEHPCTDEFAIRALNSNLRGQMLKEAVKKYNEEGKTPWIFDIGPAEYWMAIGMDVELLKFTYKSQTLGLTAETEARHRLADRYADNPTEDQPIIFVACELIEHLWNEDEFMTYYARAPRMPDQVLLSTPKYCFDERHDWKETKMAHLRAYTPNEFVIVLQRLLPQYNWDLKIDALINAIGKVQA